MVTFERPFTPTVAGSFAITGNEQAINYLCACGLHINIALGGHWADSYLQATWLSLVIKDTIFFFFFFFFFF